MCFYGGFCVLVLDEAVRVAASLFGLYDDFLDLAKGLKETSQVPFQFILRKLDMWASNLGVNVGDKQLGSFWNNLVLSSWRISFILFAFFLRATASIC